MNQQDLSKAAKSLRLILEKTGEGDSLREAQLRDRLEFAATVLEVISRR